MQNVQGKVDLHRNMSKTNKSTLRTAEQCMQKPRDRDNE